MASKAFTPTNNNVVDTQGKVWPKGASYSKENYAGLTNGLGINNCVSEIPATNKLDFTTANASILEDVQCA